MNGEDTLFKSKEGSKMGKDHHQKKLRFKSNPKLAPKKPATKKLAKLPSNHDKYEETEEDSFTESELFDKDFKRIAELPTSQGSYFQEDNEYFSTPEPNLKVDFFNLDLKLFNLAMQTIPFYERIGLDPTLIKTDKEKMDEEAEKNLIAYKKYLAEKTQVKNCEKMENITLHQKTEEKSENPVQTSESNGNLKHAVVQNLEDIPNEAMSKKIEISPESQEIAELEDWLDDVLN